MSTYSLSRILLTNFSGRGKEYEALAVRVGVEGVAMDGRLAMEGATDGTEVRGRLSAENDGSVARTECGGSMPRPALCKPRATAIITHQIYSHL